MKTSVVMIRKMGSFDVQQRTKDQMFNATSLLTQFNKGKRGTKDISSFLVKKSTKEFIEALSESENVNTRNLVLTSKGKNAGGTWMHPFLFIDFAMWINPKFKVKVIKFVYDELIKSRNDAGDNYISLSASGLKLKGYNFSEVATAMNWIVFGKKAKLQRQTATQEELKELNILQTKLSFAIDMGYISTYQGLISEMRKIYHKKNNKF